MEGDQRRAEIIQYLKSNEEAVSGTEIAKKFSVSRQIIVQDIALLRAVNKNILSTNKGYILLDENEIKNKKCRTFKVLHEENEIRDELYTIVDLGGKLLDVVVEHEIYGQITVDLIIQNRSDVDHFLEKKDLYQTRPLYELTGGIHFHTVEAEEEAILDRIEEALIKKGYLQN